jgi:hypothetical protein
MEEEFKDTKGVIKIRISKNKKHDRKKKYKRKNHDLQNIHITSSNTKPVVNSSAPEKYKQFLLH